MTVPGNLSSPLLATAAAGAAAAAGPIKSLRFNSADSAHLTRTPSSAGNRRTWTWAAWIKRGNLGGYQSLFADQVSGGTDGAAIYFNTGDNRLVFEEYSSGGIQWKLRTEQRFRDCSGWYHLTVVFNSPASTANERMRIYVNGSEVTDFADRTNPSQNFEGSLNRARITDIASYGAFDTSYFDGYLADIYFIDGSALDPTSFGAYDSNNVWQAAAYSGTFGTNGFHLLDFANEATVGHDSSGNEHDFTANNLSSGFTAGKLYKSSTLYTTKSDVTANATLISNGAALSSEYLYYVPTGSEPDGAKAFDAPGEETATGVIDFYYHTGSAWIDGVGAYNDGEIVKFTFGSDSNIEQLTKSRDFYVIGSNLGNDSSGLPPNTFSGTAPAVSSGGANKDVLFDSPTNGTQSDTGAGGEVSGCYATLNPLHKLGDVVLANGNLDVSWSAANGHSAYSTIAISSGKFYWEFTVSGTTSIGIYKASSAAGNWPGIGSDSYGYAPNGQKVTNSSYTNYGTAHSSGDVIGVAFDADSGKLYFSLNGTWQNSSNPENGTNPAFTGLTASAGYYAAIGYWSGGNSNSANFGQRSWAYTAPSGYKALCTTNLPTPTIADPSEYFETVLYSGNQTAKSITTGHASDFVWLKVRNQGNNHFLFDSVRGVGRRLMTSGNNDEDGDSSTDTLTSFNSTGFSIGADTATGGVNANSAQMVAYSWVAASSTANNTDGSITSSVRANQTAGFSIVKYTGSGSNATVGHGLNVALDFITVKRLDANGEWRSWHNALANNKGIDINSTGAAFTDDSFNTTIPTSSVFSLKGGVGNVNASGGTYIAYCFSAVAGYSAFGSYEGNSGQNFQYTGFQPRWIMIKTTSITAYPAYTGWAIFDTERPPAYNVNVNSLFANNTNQEGKRGNNSTASAPDFGIDILSNGFCLRDNGASEINLNNEDYIYLAFANDPFQANGGLAR